jgi:hypothetical protein
LVRLPFGEVACFAHAEKIQKKSRSRYAGQNKKGGGIVRVHDDDSGQRRAERRADALRGNHRSLGQIEMTGFRASGLRSPPARSSENPRSTAALSARFRKNRPSHAGFFGETSFFFPLKCQIKKTAAASTPTIET